MEEGISNIIYEWDEWAMLPGGEEKYEEVDEEMGNVQIADNTITVNECLRHEWPLHYACEGGASLDVIKYLVEEADGDIGKELLDKMNDLGKHPLHCACNGGASLDVIKYLVEEADGDKGKGLLGKEDRYGRYPLHLACEGCASLDVIKYLVEEADGDKGKELLGKLSSYGKYPLHYACEGGASLEVIKYLVEEADGDKRKELLGKKDNYFDMHPLHYACEGGASLDVIKYLLNEADGDKGKILLGRVSKSGRYPLHCACEGGASLEVIKYLVEADGEKGKKPLVKWDKYSMFPLHLACEGGASLDVIKYLVEEADDDKGKILLGRVNSDRRYPLHLACHGGASFDMIKYLVEEADGEKGKEPLGKMDKYGRYPLHLACEKGASFDVIKYLVEETDGDKGKEPLGKADNRGMYPLHYACKNRAAVDVIKYLIKKNPGPLQHEDGHGLTPLDLMDNDASRAIWGTHHHQTGTVADKSSDIDRLNYLIYARALAYAARQAEQPGNSLCVGLYARWGGGKSTLWKQIKKCLRAEFLEGDTLLLYKAYKLFGKSILYKEAAENAKIPFKNAVERLISDPYVLHDTKGAWRGREKFEERPIAPLTYLEHLVCLFLYLCICRSCEREYVLENDDIQVNDVHSQNRIRSQYARSRRMETNAIFCLVFLVSLSPIWILYWPIYIYFLACSKGKDGEENDNDYLEKDAKQIAGIITGDVPLGDGDAHHWDMVPCGTFFVIIVLQIVRAIVSLVSYAFGALQHVVCLNWCHSRTNYTPTGAVKYKIVEFNAWTYQGSDLLWASLMKELWDAVEAEFGWKAVRYHRAGIELAEENVYDETDRTLPPQQKARNRKRAILMFRARSFLYLFIFLIVFTVLLTLTIMNCANINRTCLGKLSNITDNATEIEIVDAIDSSSSEEEGNEGGVLAAVIATVATFCPLVANAVRYYKKILPYTRMARGDFILEKASSSSKKDFKDELGFMGEVKTEIGYLFDLLTTETYLDEEIGCNRSLRLCVFIDDLDRCPKEAVVSVLEAVILLLVDGPISVWVAIDSRVVVQCIEAVKLGLFDKANISGHEFLDKIIQLPFVLPELTNDAKKSYLDKIVDEKELDPGRVLSRYMKEGLDRKLGTSGLFLNEVENQHKDSIFPLSRIATELDKRGHFTSPHCHQAVIGMTKSELIKKVAVKPQNACAEHREILCSMISQATLHFIQGAQLGELDDESDDQKAPDTEFNSSNSKPDCDTNCNNVNVLGPPPSGLYIPMLNETDRRCLETLMPFIDGNPRRMKRIINVFNVSRRIAELRFETSSPILTKLTAKILKLVILVEQWPYRMAWLLQFIEDVKQMNDHGVEETRLKRFLEERLGRNIVLPDGSSWVVICRAGILEVYRRVVCESMSCTEPSNMGTIDYDPQLFEGLLLCIGEDKQYTITIHDLRPLGCNNIKNETCLRSYMFNMPQAIPGKVSLIMNKMLINT